jgi:hypothetical protein
MIYIIESACDGFKTDYGARAIASTPGFPFTPPTGASNPFFSTKNFGTTFAFLFWWLGFLIRYEPNHIRFFESE